MPDYDAFISYSHALDKPVAAALQTAVQRLGKPWYRRRALRVFRDDTSLSATPTLWPSIEHALARSRFLILLASPQSAASQWVGKEVAYWLANKSVDTFLLAVTDGEVVWDDKVSDFVWTAATPLPVALKERFSAEPKWVDLRDFRTSAPVKSDKFLDLAADLAAAIRGIPKEDLLSQEVRQQRRALTLAWSAVAALLVLAGAAGWQWRVAQAQRTKAENALATAAGTADRLVYDLALDLRNRRGMPVDLVLNILDRAVAMQSQLANAQETTPELRRLEATAMGELATTLIDQGARTSAKSAAERSLTVVENLVKSDPANKVYQRDLSIAFNKAGDAAVALGEVLAAAGFFQRAREVIEALVKASPQDDQLQDDLAACLARVGAAQVAAGKRAEALSTFQEAVAILEKLAVGEPNNATWKYNLSSAYNRVGLISKAMGQSPAALKAFQAALTIRQTLAAAEPNNTEFQRGLFDDYSHTGDIFADTGNRGDAFAAYEKGLAVIEKLATSDPANRQWQNELSRAYDNAGWMAALAGDNDRALDELRKSLAVRTRLVATNPSNANWQRAIEVDQNRIGDILLAAGKRDEATDAYRQALAIAQKLLAAAPPDTADWLGDLAFCYVKLGNAYVADDRAQSRDFYRQGLAIREKLFATDETNVQAQHDLAFAYEQLARVDAADGENANAAASLRKAVALRGRIAATDPDNTLWQIDLVLSLYWLGQAGDDPQARDKEALAIAQKLDSVGKLDANQKMLIDTLQRALAALPQK
jgi:tetratricopeptide (TPR) repeat protein